MRSELSDREIAVLTLVAEGKANKQVARLLNISENTVKTHMKRICQKLGAVDGAHAVGLGHVKGVLDDSYYHIMLPILPHELQYMRAIANGATVTSIAQQRHLTPDVRKREMAALYAKTGAVDQANLVHLGFRSRKLHIAYPTAEFVASLGAA